MSKHLDCEHLFERRSWDGDGLNYSKIRCQDCGDQVPLSEACRCVRCPIALCATCVVLQLNEASEEEAAANAATDPDYTLPED